MLYLGLNWSILILFLALGVLGLWVAYSFLNKNGLYLFCLIAPLFAMFVGDASMFSKDIAVLTVIMPTVYLALLTCLNKFGKEEAKRLFFMTLISFSALFVCTFFQAAYIDASLKGAAFLTWDYLGRFLSPIISFAAACCLTFFITSKVNLKKVKRFLKLSIFIAIASVIDVLVYTIFVFTGTASFGYIILTILIKIVIVALISVGLGYFEKFLNREPKKVEEVKEETKETESAQEDNTPKDID